MSASRARGTALIWDDALAAYRFTDEHPPNPRRLELTLDLIRALGLLGDATRIEPASTLTTDALRLQICPVRTFRLGSRGPPYAGGHRIAEAGKWASPGALLALTTLPDRRQALEYLRRVAVAKDPVAHVAVGLLARDTGPQGLAILRELYQLDLVSEPLAREELDAVASYHKWNRVARVSGMR